MSYALRPELRNLKPPKLLLMGDKDLEGPATLAEQMAAIAPHGRFEFVRSDGEWAVYGIRAQRGGPRELDAESNMLAEFFGRPELPPSHYPRVIWNFLGESA